MRTHTAPPLVRSDIAELKPVTHGSIAATELAQFGLTLANAIDFSVNTNPLGPAPSVLRAIQQTDWTRYPGDDEAPLRNGLARQAGVLPEQVALGNGSVELLWWLALATLRPGDGVVVVGPTFGEYARAARSMGATVSEEHSLADLHGARIVFVCNPNNPSGLLYGRTEIERLLGHHAERMLVLDEAYAAFAADRWRSEALLENHLNLVILRSLTKDHALPGLRLGYTLAAPELIRAIEAVRPPWTVNAGALRAGLATLEPDAATHLEKACAVIGTARALLTEGLTELGYTVQPAAANFVLVHVGDASLFRRLLLPHGLVVRDCTSFGLPSHVRIACRPPEECTTLLELVGRLVRMGSLPRVNRG